jgi:hypothetical protein
VIKHSTLTHRSRLLAQPKRDVAPRTNSNSGPAALQPLHDIPHPSAPQNISPLAALSLLPNLTSHAPRQTPAPPSCAHRHTYCLPEYQFNRHMPSWTPSTLCTHMPIWIPSLGTLPPWHPLGVVVNAPELQLQCLSCSCSQPVLKVGQVLTLKGLDMGQVPQRLHLLGPGTNIPDRGTGGVVTTEYDVRQLLSTRVGHNQTACQAHVVCLCTSITASRPFMPCAYTVPELLSRNDTRATGLYSHTCLRGQAAMHIVCTLAHVLAGLVAVLTQ